MEWVFDLAGYCFMAAFGAVAWGLLSSIRDRSQETDTTTDHCLYP